MKNSSSLTIGLLAWFFLLFLSSDVKSQDLEKKASQLEKDFASLINQPDKGEAYPFISADGLRLYFTADREGGFGRIYFCFRKSVNENFSKPVIVSKNITDGYFCATLTADELTIYMAKQGEIYVSKRTDLHSEFSKPEIVKGLIEGFKFAPAISPDGNELILVKELSSINYQTFVYRKTVDHNFKQTGTLTHPKGILGGGQFSKDGLGYYVSYETFDSANGDVGYPESIAMTLVKYTRRTLSSVFEIIENLPGIVNPTKRNHQPTVNGDGTIMVIVNTEKYDWRYNELSIINLNEEIINEDSVGVVCDRKPEEVFCVQEKSIRDDTLIQMLLNVVKIGGITFFGSDESELKETPVPWYEDLSTLYHRPKLIDSIETVIDTVFCTFGETPGESLSELVTNISLKFPETISQVKVYPNPFIDNMVVTIENRDVNSNFELYDISGRKVLTTKLNNTVNRIQLNKPVAGIYIYRIIGGNGEIISSGKIIKK